MKLDVVFLPRDLTAAQTRGRAVVVLDVLRATTSMIAALAAGAREIRIFDDLEQARTAARDCSDAKLLCGERQCLPPAGFDLGNSPGAFAGIAHGRVLFLCTTNGTRAIASVRQAHTLLVGALVNAATVGQYLSQVKLDVTLVCAGTDGALAMEDMLGAGAIIDAMSPEDTIEWESDAPQVAQRLFRAARNDLPGALREARGGRNVLAAGLGADIEFAACLNTIPIVGHVHDQPLRVTH